MEIHKVTSKPIALLPYVNDVVIVLTPEEVEHLKEMVRCAKLPQRQVFHKLLEEI